MKNTTSQTVNSFEKKRRALLIIPFLLVPLLALAFYAMGGGRATTSGPIVSTGLNTSLPDASFKKEEPKDKLALYQQDKQNLQDSGLASVAGRLGFKPAETDQQTRQIDQRIETLTQEITKAQQTPTPPRQTPTVSNSSIKADIDRLEELMEAMQQQKGEDPEMKQINTMLQSIIDIQHPERIVNPAKQAIQSRDPFRAFRAEIDGKQKVGAGASVKLKLLDTLELRNHTFYPGQSLYGICRLANHRLLLDIESIRQENVLLPADLTVYSLDGMPGIDAPEAELGAAAGNGADQAMRGIDLGMMDQTAGTLLAEAGINATRGLLSKKIRKIRVPLKDGLVVLLRNNQLKPGTQSQ